MQRFDIKFSGGGLSTLADVDVRVLARRCKDTLHDVLIRGVLDVFEAEGIPAWPPLAELTIVQRRWLGFSEGPILQRTGELLRSLTEPSHRHHIFEVKMGKTRAQIIVGTDMEKAWELGHGDPEANLPPRPMFPSDRIIHPELEGTINDAGHAL